MCSEFNPANSNYFSDYAYPSTFPGSTGEVAAAIPLDSSLQVQVAFAQYAVFKNPQAPRICPDAGAAERPEPAEPFKEKSMRATRRTSAGAIALALTISCAGDRGSDAPNVARAPEAQAPRHPALSRSRP